MFTRQPSTGVWLSDVVPDDAAWLAGVFGSWCNTARWSRQGCSPSPAVLDHLLWEGVALQQVVRTAAGNPLALFQVVDRRAASGYGYLELVADPTQVDRWDPMLADVVERAFRDLSLRKLCLKAVEDELTLPPSLAVGARRAGRLDRHERRDDSEYVALDLYEIWPGTTSPAPQHPSTSNEE